LRVLNKAYDHPLKSEEKASMPFAGGIMQHGYQCGMIWGAVLAAGAQTYRQYGTGAEAESVAVRVAKRLVDAFHELNDNINCLEITEIDKSSTSMDMIMYFLIKGGTIGCVRRASKYAAVAFKEINKAFSEKEASAPSLPVSCAAIVAQRMGATDEHQIMAAGLAGGIGLCGGACGALGAAIWILGMNINKETGGKIDFKNPQVLDLIDRFLKCTDYKFECAEIVGRKFENIADHSDYLRKGGCSEIVDILATNDL
jgi:hypothetical protein